MVETGHAVVWMFKGRFWNYRFLVLQASVQYERVHDFDAFTGRYDVVFAVEVRLKSLLDGYCRWDE